MGKSNKDKIADSEYSSVRISPTGASVTFADGKTKNISHADLTNALLKKRQKAESSKKQ